jgi:plastocyanin
MEIAPREEGETLSIRKAEAPMNTLSVRLAATAILAFTACTPEPLTPQSPAVPVSPAVTAATGAAPPTAQEPASARGNVVGTISTNPWHAIKGGGVVYLEDGPRETGVSLSGTLDNHDMTFVPYIAVIVAGGSVIFTNTDPVMHNVFSPDGEKWNLGEIPQNGSVVKRFDTPGTYVVLCNLHPTMIAYLVVSPSSYFAKTNSDGVFAIKNVPAGTYHVTAWVPRLKPVTQSVTLTGGEATLNFDLKR